LNQDEPKSSGRCLIRIAGLLLVFTAGTVFGAWLMAKAGIFEGKGSAALDLVAGGEDAEQLLALEDRVRRDPGDLVLGTEYRKQCCRLGAHDRSIELFVELARAHPDIANVRLQLASAYVDKIPTCSGMAAFMTKGTLAQKSLDQLDAVLAAEPDSWAALYTRAMNHLHWPRALNHSDDAARDFQSLIELQEAAAGDSPPHFLWAYRGLGDARAKDGDFERARAAWARGRERFPSSDELESRLALGSAEAALAFVVAECSLESEIETDYSFLAEP
jgi:tetratricopeptide (TPR) repeat protein